LIEALTEKLKELRVMKWSKLYLLALIPTTLLAAEAVVVAEQVDSIVPALMQGGIGGIVGLIAVKMLLVLYNDKEKNTSEYHQKLIQLIENQIKISSELITSNNHVVRIMESIQKEILENRELFTNHIRRDGDERHR
jgi:hypothetical protein